MTDTTKYEALKLENQLCFPLYAVSREIIKQYRPYLEDLTYTQYIAMIVFWEEKKLRVMFAKRVVLIFCRTTF